MQDPPGALKKPRPNGAECIESGEYIAAFRKHFDLTQMQAASTLGLAYRRLQALECTAHWSAANKSRLKAFPGIFDFSKTMKLAKRGWSNQRSLGAEIERMIAEKPERKRYARSTKIEHDEDSFRMEEALRSNYKTKVLITEDSIVFLHFGNEDIKAMLFEKLVRVSELGVGVEHRG